MFRFTRTPLIVGLVAAPCLGTLLSAQATKRTPVNEAETTRAWEALEKNPRAAITHADTVIRDFARDANEKQAELASKKAPTPPVGKVDEKARQVIFDNGPLNDVATCYFIKGQALEKLGRTAEAKQAYESACKLTYARTWDPNGWFWDPAAKSCDRAASLK